ncbi:unnamed protein product [Ilex paraguariensis]|uniref:Uncharacterized protein n=1 Tax=Ilex paraguariensis TaxID=185542 RepID=A0ABC8QUW0_9AQUA
MAQTQGEKEVDDIESLVKAIDCFLPDLPRRKHQELLWDHFVAGDRLVCAVAQKNIRKWTYCGIILLLVIALFVVFFTVGWNSLQKIYSTIGFG